jgi:hypothetical protein
LLHDDDDDDDDNNNDGILQRINVGIKIFQLIYEPQYDPDDRVTGVFYYQQLKDGLLLPKALS